MSGSIVCPRPLVPGDKVRFVSPASTPEREPIEQAAELLRGWGFEVDFGKNAFNKYAFLAGTDEERLSDLNEAIREPSVRAIFATRGGKGSYRIVDGVDFEAWRRDPKVFLGYSDNTIIHMAMWKHGIGGGLHGALRREDADLSSARVSVHAMLTGAPTVRLESATEAVTSVLTTHGTAQGPLLGGNLALLATAAGWALPKLDGAILLLEAINMGPGAVDRDLTMLRKAGHLDGVAGVAVGQFTDFERPPLIMEILRQHFAAMNVPVLGGLPLGHERTAVTVPLGRVATLDADAGLLTVGATAE